MHHGWLMKPDERVGNLLSPTPLLHKSVEERENTREVSLHEPAVGHTGWLA
jgi:hypothetical protein